MAVQQNLFAHPEEVAGITKGVLLLAEMPVLAEA
jgi:hypothetical protein